MLTKEINDKLTRVGAGSPMGEVLRRYWHPVAGVDELERSPTKPIKLLGEDLVLYRDKSGNYGLLDRHCAHRRADLSQGIVEQHGIRCFYHGWQYDSTGQCTHQPFEQQVDPAGSLCARTRLKAYSVKPAGGMLWAYLGPSPSPELPDWEAFHWANGFVQVVFSEVPCNWLQAQENSIDPVHFEWTHANWSRRQRDDDAEYVPTHTKLNFEEFEHGFLYKRICEDTSEEDPLWTIGRVCLWPNGFFLGDHFEWRVPIDDENMLSVTWSFIRVPREREPYEQQRIPSWHSPIQDGQGNWITSHVINQDIVAWVGQGRITDRTCETLGASDRGVALLRRRLLDDIDAVESGRDPKGVLRDPSPAGGLYLPSDHREFFLDGLPEAEYLNHPKWALLLTQFIFHAGQPEDVKAACEAATGVPMKSDDLIDL